MRYWIVIAVILLVGDTTSGQTRWSTPTLGFNQGSSNTSKPILVNGLSPSAALNSNKEIICAATDWIEHYPLIAERVDSSGRLLWNTVRLSKPQNLLDQNGLGAYILPKPDGGAYFIFEFWEFRGRSGHAKLYASYPHIQLVDAGGNIRWGVDGKRLTNMVLSYHGGAGVSLTNYSPDGDIIVYWTWFDQDSLFNTSYGVYAQKISAASGELLWGETGRMLFDHFPVFATSTVNGTTYIGHKDSVACFDAWGQLRWDYPLLSGMNAYGGIATATNDNGDLLILYATGQDLRARLYDNNGSPLWVDKILSTSVQWIQPSTKVANWANTRWVFKMGAIGSAIFCVDRAGTMCWGDSGIVVSDRVLTAMPVNDENVFVAFQKPREGEAFSYDLMIQKLNASGRAVWQAGGIKVFENISVNCVILPHSAGGAYLVFDALTQYEPEFRPRGTYMQKIDKNGNLGIITAIQEEKLTPSAWKNSSIVYPNPFNSTTTIRLTSDGQVWGGSVRLTIYDILGREVRRYNIENPSSGVVSIQWDGRDDRGTEVAPGIYFYRVLTKNNIVLSGKLLRTQ